MILTIMIYMDSIIRLYRSNYGNRELEIRLRNLNADRWLKLVKNATIKFGKSIPNRTVEFYFPNNLRRIKSCNNAKSDHREYKFKREIKSYQLDDNIKIVLSEEKVVEPFVKPNTDVKMCRLKIRHSFTCIPETQWRIDATIVKCITDIANFSNIIVDEFFKPFNNLEELVNSRLDRTDSSIAFEYEIEFIGNQIHHLTTKSIEDIIGSTCGGMYEELPSFRHVLSNPLRPKPLTRDIYTSKIYGNLKDWYITPKSDGINYFISLKPEPGKSGMYITDECIELTKKITVDKFYIFQGEFIDENLIYVIDVFQIGDDDLLKLNFIERYNRANEIVKLSSVFQCKPQYAMDVNLSENIDKIIKLPDQDGIIFNLNAPYDNGKIYKWKPPNQLSIDLLIVNANNGKDYYLYCNATSSQIIIYRLEGSLDLNNVPRVYNGSTIAIFKSQLYSDSWKWTSPTGDTSLDGKIGSFLWNTVETKMMLLEIRTDKGCRLNNYATCMTLMIQRYIPITPKELKNPVTEGYFRFEKSQEYKNQTKFITYVREMMYKQSSTSNSILVLAAGKGQEIFMTTKTTANIVVHLDVCIRSLQTLIERLTRLGDPKWYGEYGRLPDSFPSHYVVPANLTDSYDTIIDKIYKVANIKSFNLVTIMLALHYVIRDTPSLNNFFQLIDTVLHRNGVLCVMGLDGRTVMNTLRSNSLHEIRIPKTATDPIYHIRLNSASSIDDPNLCNVMIDCKLPFTDEYYSEYLIDYKMVTDKFISEGYQLRQYGPVTHFKSGFNARYSNRMLSMDDLEYLSYYYYMSVYKL